MRHLRKVLIGIGLAGIVALSGCGQEQFTEEEKQVIGQLRLSQLPPLPADPSNRVADDAAAAAFGATLFFDKGFSSNGEVACATCHLIDRQFQDDLPLAKGVGTTNRRTMPLANVAYSPWQFWDGRKDSLWAQALGPMEDAREHAGNRTAFAHDVAKRYRDRYEAIFGTLPELEGLPRDASPLGSPEERKAWTAIEPARQVDVDTVFANLGKAIAAFERTIRHNDTRFDRFAEAIVAGRQPEGDAVLTSLEVEGLRLFIGKGNCINCHNGPRFTDDFFHNTGVPAVPGLPDDLGRAQAIRKVVSDPFNCLGPYSDAMEEQCAELRFMVLDSPEMERAFKTPSLRGASSRPPYMHAGQFATLDEVIDHYSSAPDAPAGHTELQGVIFTERGRAALIAFLKTLEM